MILFRHWEGLPMQEQIRRGRTLLLALLSSVGVIFIVNIFYRLYIAPPDRANRFMVLVLMLTLATLAYKGVRGMRAAAGARPPLVAAFTAIGWLLLFSKSVRAFEAARQNRTA